MGNISQMEMTILKKKTKLPDWLKNISNNDVVDVLDKGTSENYLPQWMLGKIDKIEYKPVERKESNY